MKIVLWLVMAALIAVAGLSIYWALQNSTVLYGIGTLGIAWFFMFLRNQIIPWLLRHSVEAEARAKKEAKEGKPTPRDRPPNITTGKVTVKPADTNRDHRGENHR